MKRKIRSWLKDAGNAICGIGLLCAGLCAVAFGGAYLGANAAINNHEVAVRFDFNDESMPFQKSTIE